MAERRRKRHYSAETMAKMKARGRALARKYGFGKKHHKRHHKER